MAVADLHNRVEISNEPGLVITRISPNIFKSLLREHIWVYFNLISSSEIMT